MEENSNVISEMSIPVHGALFQERKLEIISNHLANADTNGFKADILTFDQILKDNLTTDFRPGDIVSTANPLDLALTDEGFFTVQTPYGVRYTRDGNFSLDSQGTLVTQSGDTVLGDGGPIVIDGTDIAVGPDGEMRVDGESVGRLKIVTFKSLQNLRKEGASLYAYNGPISDETLPQTVSVQQRALERSNVSTVVEMTKMIETMRNYESFQKVIQSLDETNAKAVNEVGKLL